MATVTVVALVLTAVLQLLLAGIAWRYRDRRGAKLFTVLEVTAGIWAGLTAVGLTTPAGSLRIRIWGATSALSLLVIIFWIGFILSYTGRDHWLGPRRLGLLSSPLVVPAGLYLSVPDWTPLVGDLTQTTIGAGTVVTSSIGSLGVVVAVYVYLVFVTGLALVVKTVLEGSRLFVGQALAFVVGSLTTIVASLLAVLEIGVAGYPLIPVALGPQAVLWGYAVFGQQFLQVVPAAAEIGERAVFDDLDDGILVVTSDGMVVRTNPQLQSQLDGRDPTGESVDAVLAVMDVDSLEDLPTRFEYRSRTYRASSSEIRDWQGEPVGDAVIVQDINQLVTREQRLAVLNRILRHNVRNDMNVVLGIGETLQNNGNEKHVEYGQSLGRTARRLNRVSEKALEINRLFERSAGVDRVDLSNVVAEIVRRLGEDYPGVTIETSIDAESVRTDGQVLSKVIEEAVANALEHGGDELTISTERRATDGTVTIEIVDEGPGIPRSELRPIQAGEETPLEHTSSFGLWFIKWGTEKLGGGVDIVTGDGGTSVTLAVPDGADHVGQSAGVTADADVVDW